MAGQLVINQVLAKVLLLQSGIQAQVSVAPGRSTYRGACKRTRLKRWYRCTSFYKRAGAAHLCGPDDVCACLDLNCTRRHPKRFGPQDTSDGKKQSGYARATQKRQ